MEIDGRYCFQCDLWLGAPLSSGDRVRICASCQADLDAFNAAVDDNGVGSPPAYRGTVRLGMPLDGWPTEIALIALDVWDHCIDLSLIERPGTAPDEINPRLAATSGPGGDMPPRKWALRTDAGSVHHSGSGGGGTPGTDRILAWSTDLAPTLPVTATRIDVLAVAPGARGHASVVLDRWPASPVAAQTSAGQPADGDPDCPACGLPPPPPKATPAPPGPAITLSWAMPEPSAPHPMPPATRGGRVGPAALGRKLCSPRSNRPLRCPNESSR